MDFVCQPLGPFSHCNTNVEKVVICTNRSRGRIPRENKIWNILKHQQRRLGSHRSGSSCFKILFASKSMFQNIIREQVDVSKYYSRAIRERSSPQINNNLHGRDSHNSSIVNSIASLSRPQATHLVHKKEPAQLPTEL